MVVSPSLISIDEETPEGESSNRLPARLPLRGLLGLRAHQDRERFVAVRTLGEVRRGFGEAGAARDRTVARRLVESGREGLLAFGSQVFLVEQRLESGRGVDVLDVPPGHHQGSVLVERTRQIMHDPKAGRLAEAGVCGHLPVGNNTHREHLNDRIDVNTNHPKLLILAGYRQLI